MYSELNECGRVGRRSDNVLRFRTRYKSVVAGDDLPEAL